MPRSIAQIFMQIARAADETTGARRASLPRYRGRLMSKLIPKDPSRERSGLIHYTGECETCGQQFSARNVVGLAAQHARKYGHNVRVETGRFYRFDYSGKPTPDE